MHLYKWRLSRSSEIINTDLFSYWRLDTTEFCNRNFLGYGHEFARLKDVLIFPLRAHGRPGGEPIEKVLNQNESAEYTTLEKGFFQLSCMNSYVEEMNLKYWYKGKSNYLTSYQDSLVTLPLNQQIEEESQPSMLKDRVLFITTRFEYVNLYQSMTGFYNAYLIMKFFRLQPTDVAILLIDGHPAGGLDSVWNVLFSGVVMRVGQLESKKAIRQHDAVFVMQSHNSPLNQHLVKAPLLDEFRSFFLERYSLSPERDAPLDCNKLRVLFLWRRNYVAHPRNPYGDISRKIINENELIDAARRTLPSRSIVQGVQIDQLSFADQLRLISETDILIGMHGAGLTHVLFLPKFAALIELYPNYWSHANRHFRTFASWRGLTYELWVNRDKKNEVARHYTRVPVNVINNLLNQVLRRNRCK